MLWLCYGYKQRVKDHLASINYSREAPLFTSKLENYNTVKCKSRSNTLLLQSSPTFTLHTRPHPHTHIPPQASCQCSCRQLNSHETHFQWDSDHDCLSQQRAVAPLPARCHQHSDKTPGTNLSGFHNLPRPLQVSRGSAGDQQVASRAAQASIL